MDGKLRLIIFLRDILIQKLLELRLILIIKIKIFALNN